MDVIYNSDHYSVLAYPAEEIFELVDKESQRSLSLRGPYAWQFRASIEQIPEDERTEECIDALLDEVCAGAASPIVFH